MVKLMAIVNDLEHIGDVIEVNLAELGEQRIKQGFNISEATQKVMNTVHVVVSDALKSAGYDGWLTIESFSRALLQLAAATRIWRDLSPSLDEVWQEGFTLIRKGWDTA
jgi:hypothetical protein